MGNDPQTFPKTADPAAWEPDDLERSEAWRHEFTGGELAELLASARDGHDGEPRRAPDLPLLASQMARTARELKAGLGLRVLRGLPAGRLNHQEVAHAFAALNQRLGQPVEQPGGVKLAHVRAEPGDNGKLGFRATGALPFHADPEDVIGFLCLRPALKGGVRRFASAATVYNILATDHPDLLQVLTRPYHVALTHPHPDHGHRWTRVPFLSIRDGVFHACAYPVHIRQAQRLAGVPELTAAQTRALDVFNTVADQVAVSLELEPGDVEYFNNHVILHTRTRFAGGGAGRHLLRVWLSLAGFRPLHPEHPIRLGRRMNRAGAG